MKHYFFCLLSLVLLTLGLLMWALLIEEPQYVQPEVYRVFPKAESDIDIEEEVFGVVYNQEFEPGWYKPLVDEDIPLSPQDQLAIQHICNEYDICYELVLEIMRTESGFNPSVSRGPCKGAMQINTNFHKCDDPYDLIQNVTAGVKYLRTLFDEYEDDAMVLMTYHGESNAKEKLNKGQISYYARSILERSEELERKHSK